MKVWMSRGPGLTLPFAVCKSVALLAGALKEKYGYAIGAAF